MEKEDFDIHRTPGDQFYIEADTAVEERLQALRGRTIAMWESWYHGGVDRDLEPQLHRRWQPRPADEPEDFPPPRKRHVLLDWLRQVLRSAAGTVAESRICQILHDLYPRRFVKSLENARTDGALLLDDFFDADQESLERHDRLENGPGPTPPFLPVDIKHTVACPRWKGDPKSWSHRWNYVRVGRWEEDKRQRVLILTSAIDPGRVVVCPATAFFQTARKGGDGWDDQGPVLITETEVLPGQTCPPAFASHLKPYEISISEIGEVLSLLMRCAQNGTKAW